jgi:hypothetical protein
MSPTSRPHNAAVTHYEAQRVQHPRATYASYHAALRSSIHALAVVVHAVERKQTQHTGCLSERSQP